MSKIENPVVLIHKRDNNDSYAVAITSGSQNFHDAVLMASMEPDMVGDDVDTWSKTGYGMAAEIESLREKLKQAEEKHIHLQGLVDDYDWQRQRLHSAAKRIIRWNRQEAIDRTGDAENAESYACVRELRDALSFCEGTCRTAILKNCASDESSTNAGFSPENGETCASASRLQENPKSAGAAKDYRLTKMFRRCWLTTSPLVSR